MLGSVVDTDYNFEKKNFKKKLDEEIDLIT